MFVYLFFFLVFLKRIKRIGIISIIIIGKTFLVVVPLYKSDCPVYVVFVKGKYSTH